MIATKKHVFDMAEVMREVSNTFDAAEGTASEVRALCFALKAVAEYSFEREASAAIYALADRATMLVDELDHRSSEARQSLHPYVFGALADS